MKDNVKEELESLKKMLQNWAKGYLNWASPDGGNEYIVIEFRDEITTHLYPYVQRLFEAEHLSEAEAREFIGYCEGKVKALEEILKIAGSSS